MFERNDYLILLAAFLSFLFSVSLWFAGLREEGMFVGIWVPSIFAFGAYTRFAFETAARRAEATIGRRYPS